MAAVHGPTSLLTPSEASSDSHDPLKVVGQTAYTVVDAYATIWEEIIVKLAHLVEKLVDLPKTTFTSDHVFSYAIYKIFSVVTSLVVSILSAPFRFVLWLMLDHPIITLMIGLLVYLTQRAIRSISRQAVGNVFLRRIIPYVVSIFYTVIGLFFPQLHTIAVIFSAICQPITWLRQFVTTIMRRAGVVRENIDYVANRRTARRVQTPSAPPQELDPPVVSPRRSPRLSMSEEKYKCCVCLFADKSVLLLPCGHLCMCDDCYKLLATERPTLCPICRKQVRGHKKVFL